MRSKSIKIGRKLFEFATFDDWVDNARRRFGDYRASVDYLASQRTLSLDKQGRVCLHGKDFIRADEDRTYPIRVYSIDI